LIWWWVAETNCLMKVNLLAVRLAELKDSRLKEAFKMVTAETVPR
jgi:hypothetical protein